MPLPPLPPVPTPSPGPPLRTGPAPIASSESLRRAAARVALALDDATLAAGCVEEFFVAGGPGGQHRNKTASGVRLTHAATELSVTATERRSQAQNRSMALQRLRQALRQLTFVPKPRKKTRVPRGSKERRLEAKKRTGARKAQRRSPED